MKTILSGATEIARTRVQMPRKAVWTTLITRHFLAKLIILSMAFSSGAVWAGKTTYAAALREKVIEVTRPRAAHADDKIVVPAAALKLTVGVMPSRLIVVDREGRITGIWSNTLDIAEGAYTIKVRQGGPNGQEQNLTEAIQTQYQALKGTIDWGKTGEVYKAG